MSILVSVDKDDLTLDDLESLIMMSTDICEQVRRDYLRLIEKLRAQLEARKDVQW